MEKKHCTIHLMRKNNSKLTRNNATSKENIGRTGRSNCRMKRPNGIERFVKFGQSKNMTNC